MSSDAHAGRAALGLPMTIALVMGNMIGSGVFLLPASLAPYGGVSLVGWAASTAGALLLAIVFARLARVDPAAGGVYAYTRHAFGDLAGFLVAWGYWISSWCTNAALAVALVAYLDPFIPGVVRTPSLAATAAVGLIWLLTAVNVLGVRAAGRVQVVTTVLKVLPLLVIALVGLAHIDGARLAAPASAPGGFGAGVFTTITLTLWAFLGLESATIPAGSVRDPARTIPRATLIGTACAAVIYIASTVGVMMLVGPEALAVSNAPFADAGRAVFGDAAGQVIALGAAISCFGALNGWILLVGQLPQAIADDGLFPAVFARRSRWATPALGMTVGAGLSTVLVVARASEGPVPVFTFIIQLATLATLVPYVFCSLAVFLIRSSAAERLSAGLKAVAGLAFTYALIAIGGAGAEIVYWGFILIVSGLPVYVVVVRARPKELRA